MKIKSRESINPGDIAAADVYDGRGRVLIKEGAVFNKSLIKKTAEYGIPFVYTGPAETKTKELCETEFLAEMLVFLSAYSAGGSARASLIRKYGEASLKTAAGQESETAEKISCGRIVRGIAEKEAVSVKSYGSACAEFIDYRNDESYLPFHMAMTARLSLVLAVKMGFEGKDLMDICTGALFSDMFMEIFSFAEKKPGLTQRETEEMREHAAMSAVELKEIYGVSSVCAVIAGQHHERADGSGYPGGISKGDIHLFSRIVAAADVYDALLSRRPFREPLKPQEAWDYMSENGGRLFGEEGAEVFVKTAPRFIPGDTIELNTGQTAVVTANNYGAPEMPRIKLIEKTEGRDIIFSAEKDLSEEKGIKILRTLNSAR